MGDYSYEFDWQQMQSGVAAHFSSVATVTGATATFATSCLPSGHQKMAGLQSAHWSGYTASTHVADGITGFGELVLLREDGATWKAYAYPIGNSGSETFIGAEFKSFSDHHFPSGTPVPTDGVFGNIPWPCRTDVRGNETQNRGPGTPRPSGFSPGVRKQTGGKIAIK